jgi:hypothetical protein
MSKWLERLAITFVVIVVLAWMIFALGLVPER